MPRDSLSRDKLRRPEILFKELLRKASSGKFREVDENVPFLYRALVIAIDVEGGKLENESASGRVINEVNGHRIDVEARLGPSNPPNSIKARIISDGLDKFTTDENLRIFWPFFPDSISVPVKPGEHVYVIFEDSHMNHGLWISKVAGHTGCNYSPGESFYESSDVGQLASKFDETKNLSSQGKKYDKNEDAAETTSGNKLSSLKWK